MYDNAIKHLETFIEDVSKNIDKLKENKCDLCFKYSICTNEQHWDILLAKSS